METKLEAAVVPDRVKACYEGRHRRPFSLAPELREGISQLVPRGDVAGRFDTRGPQSEPR
jgi:hypothetical protein